MTVAPCKPEPLPLTDAARGIWAPAVTPLDGDLNPDGRRFAQHVVELLDSGCHGVVVFGTTGEANSFSVAERKFVLEAAVDGGAAADRLMVGNGLCNVPETVELTTHALSLGCRSVLMLPPFYFKNASDQGLFDAYARVIDQVADDRLRIYLYHFPKLSGVAVTRGLIDKLIAAYPDTIAGIKDSSGDWENTSMLIGLYPGLAVFPGSESLLLAALRTGGAGCITASANINAAAIRSTFDAWESEDAAVDECQQEIVRVRGVLDKRPLVPVLKLVVSERAGDAAWLRVRPPLTVIDQETADSVRQDLSKVNFSF